MLINEVAGIDNAAPKKLFVLAKLFLGRSEDTTSKKQISINSFLDSARNVGVVCTPEQLADYIGTEPLSNIIEPLEPNSGVIRFKGNTDVTTDMSVDKAKDLVDKNAKAAMRRGQP